MSAMLDEVLKSLEHAGVGLKALEAIAGLVVGDDHPAIVDAVRRVVTVVFTGINGKVDPKTIMSDLDKLHVEISDIHKRIDAKIAAKPE